MKHNLEKQEKIPKPFLWYIYLILRKGVGVVAVILFILSVITFLFALPYFALASLTLKTGDLMSEIQEVSNKKTTKYWEKIGFNPKRVKKFE